MSSTETTAGTKTVCPFTRSRASNHHSVELRLKLGQFLRYRQVLALQHEDRNVIAVLVAERQPSDSTWLDICAEYGVRLVWPETIDSLFG